VYGETTPEITKVPIAISGIAGDQQAALFGQQCTESGMIKNTYGTGCFMLMNTGQRAMASKNNLLTTIAWQINGQTTYALEGSVFIGGAVVQWLRDGLKIIRESNDVESLAAKVSDTEGVYVVPAFAGLGAPHWNPHVRGSIFGLTRGSSDAHIARAALDSIAYQTFDVLRAMQADSNLPLRELRVDGGGAINNALMQFQSDVLQCDVVRPMITETTALGAAYLAGLAVGYWKDLADIQSQWNVERRFETRMTDGDRTKHLDGWQRAVAASKAWSETPKSESRA
jgi:glycerol kinase